MAHFNAYWDFDDRTTLRLRIGTGSSKQFSFQGNTFPTWNDWKSFLTHNAHRLVIKNTVGAGQEFSVEEFVKMVEGSPQYDLLDWYNEKAPRKIDNEGRSKHSVWWDDQGFFFRNEDF